MFRKQKIMSDMPEGTQDIVQIEYITIPRNFKRTTVSPWKIRRAVEYYRKHIKLDKPITVIAETNERGKRNKLILADEYSRYIAAKILYLKEVPIRYIKIEDMEDI